MTRIYRRTKKAEDLLLGDLFVDWCLNKGTENVVYGPSFRILNITEKNGRVYADMDNLARYAFYPEQLVIVEEVA